MKNINNTFILLLKVLIISVLVLSFSCSKDDGPTEPEPIGGGNDTVTPPNNDPEPNDPPPNDPPPADTTAQDSAVIRINSGGPAVSFGDTLFLEDQYYEAGNAYTNGDIEDILDTEMDSIYISERFSPDAGTYSYQIPITNGTYSVTLHFAEIFFGLPGGGSSGGEGSRIFDVMVEDSLFLDDYDIFAQVGAATAAVKVVDIEVTDQQLSIVLTASVNRAKLAAIEVFGEGEIITGNP